MPEGREARVFHSENQRPQATDNDSLIPRREDSNTVDTRNFDYFTGKIEETIKREYLEVSNGRIEMTSTN